MGLVLTIDTGCWFALKLGGPPQLGHSPVLSMCMLPLVRYLYFKLRSS
jgi:hypothetical protein